MQKEYVDIGNIPAVIYGAPSERSKVCLFVHGQSGSKEEGEAIAGLLGEHGWQVLGIDLPGHGERANEAGAFLPWVVVPELKLVRTFMAARYKRTMLWANSIGAWFSMLAFAPAPPERSMFVSPIVDMEQLIYDMMGWADVTEEQLEQEGVIRTDFGQTLSYEYLRYAREHRIVSWPSPTSVLYGSADTLTSRDTLDEFIGRFNCRLSVMEDGEHWFHTEEQLEYLSNWAKQELNE